MLLTSLALTLFASIGNMNQCAYANQLQSVNEEANTIILNAIEQMYDSNGEIMSADDQFAVFGQRFLRYAEENEIMEEDLFHELINYVPYSENAYDLAYDEAFPLLDLGDFQIEDEDINIFNPEEFEVTIDFDDLGNFDKPHWHEPVHNFGDSGDDNGDDSGDDDGHAIIDPDHDLTEMYDDGHYFGMGYNPDLDDPHTAPEGSGSSGGSGSSSGGSSSQPNEPENNSFPLQPVDYDNSKAKVTINGRVEGVAFIGVIFSPDACKAIYNFFTVVLEALSAISELAGYVDTITGVIAGLGLASAAIATNFVVDAVVAICNAMIALWTMLVNFLDTTGPVGVLVALVLALLGATCIAVLVNAFVAGAIGAGYALGWKVYHLFHWEGVNRQFYNQFKQSEIFNFYRPRKSVAFFILKNILLFLIYI